MVYSDKVDGVRYDGVLYLNGPQGRYFAEIAAFFSNGQEKPYSPENTCKTRKLGEIRSTGSVTNEIPRFSNE